MHLLGQLCNNDVLDAMPGDHNKLLCHSKACTLWKAVFQMPSCGLRTSLLNHGYFNSFLMILKYYPLLFRCTLLMLLVQQILWRVLWRSKEWIGSLLILLLFSNCVLAQCSHLFLFVCMDLFYLN